MVCDKGTESVLLLASGSANVQICGLMAAVISDAQPGANIASFGVCTKLKALCTPAPVGQWLNPFPSCLIGNKQSLLQGAKLSCAAGGTIAVMEADQAAVLMEENLASLAADDSMLADILISNELGAGFDALQGAEIGADQKVLRQRDKITKSFRGRRRRMRRIRRADRRLLSQAESKAAKLSKANRFLGPVGMALNATREVESNKKKGRSTTESLARTAISTAATTAAGGAAAAGAGTACGAVSFGVAAPVCAGAAGAVAGAAANAVAEGFNNLVFGD